MQSFRQIVYLVPATIQLRCNKSLFVSGPSKNFYSRSAHHNFGSHQSWYQVFEHSLLRKKQLHTNIMNRLNQGLTLMGMILTKQCNFYAAHRTRRLSQIWNLYSKLYRDKNVRNLVKKLKSTFIGRNRPAGFVLGATLFNWEKNEITDKDLQTCISDFDHIDRLNTNLKGTSDPKKSDNWELLVAKQNLKIWRRPIPETALYEYKVYGSFFDIPPQAFFSVQMDLDYRKIWDKHICKLNVIDSDADSGCEVVHWITRFPYPFYNREYVYIRKAKIDHENKIMVMSSRAIDHPACEVDAKNVRVDRYKSQMVIRPHKSFDENGFDYVLTYFDDPQAVFPSIAYNYLASSGVPEFVDTLHSAAKGLYDEQKLVKPYNRQSTTNSHLDHQSNNQIPAYA